MIQKGTYLHVVDNSGAKLVQCIHLYGGYRKNYASIGDVILVSIKSLKRGRSGELGKIKKGEVLKGLVVSTKTSFVTFSGFSKKFAINGIILLNEQQKQIGTRIFIPMLKFFRGTRHLKLLSISTGILS